MPRGMRMQDASRLTPVRVVMTEEAPTISGGCDEQVVDEEQVEEHLHAQMRKMKP